MNKEILKINNLGQSIWIDSISRGMIQDGKIEAMVNNGVSGITSNPSIFQKALSSENTYDEDIKKLAMSGISDPKKIFQNLSIKDITDACKILPVVHGSPDITCATPKKIPTMIISPMAFLLS